MDSFVKTIKDLIAIAFVLIMFIAMIVGIILTCKRTNEDTSSPVEECMVDSILLVNDSLIMEVNNLDSIKNVKAIEVKALDNDSTLKLFYELISR